MSDLNINFDKKSQKSEPVTPVTINKTDFFKALGLDEKSYKRDVSMHIDVMESAGLSVEDEEGPCRSFYQESDRKGTSPRISYTHESRFDVFKGAHHPLKNAAINIFADIFSEEEKESIIKFSKAEDVASGVFAKPKIFLAKALTDIFAEETQRKNVFVLNIHDDKEIDVELDEYSENRDRRWAKSRTMFSLVGTYKKDDETMTVEKIVMPSVDSSYRVLRPAEIDITPDNVQKALRFAVLCAQNIYQGQAMNPRALMAAAETMASKRQPSSDRVNARP